MIEAEKISSIAQIFGLDYPDFNNCWENTMFNQFHDILGGTSIESCHENANIQAETVLDNTNDFINKSISYIGKKIKKKKNGKAIIVFNSLSWSRTDYVKININNINKDLHGSPVITDENGNIFPAQVIDNDLFFLPKSIPPLGYKVFYISEGKNYDNLIIKNPFVFENDSFYLEIDELTGTISYLLDKKNKKTVMKSNRSEAMISENAIPIKFSPVKFNLPSTKTFMNNLMQVLLEKPHQYSIAVIGKISKIFNLIDDPEIEIISKGPVIGQIRIKHKYNNSKVIQDICVYKEMDRIDFKTIVDWKENSGPNIQLPMLTASFTPILERTKAIYEIPYGNIERVADGREFPALNWVDISDDNYGLSVLSDTKYGFSVIGNTISITLMRTSYDPFPDADIGEHQFTYSIYPHKGNFKKADTARKGYELNNPLIAISINETDNSNMLEESKSFISSAPSNIIISSFKKAEDSDDLIIRLYESKGLKTRARLKFGFNIKSATEVNLLENPIKEKDFILNNNNLEFITRPFEIKTFLVEAGK